MLSDNELFLCATRAGYDPGEILEPEACRQYLVNFIEDCSGTLNSPERIFMMGYSRLKNGQVDMRIHNRMCSMLLPMYRSDQYLCTVVVVRTLNREAGVARIEFQANPDFGPVAVGFLEQYDLVLKKFNDLAEYIEAFHKKLDADRCARWNMCKITAGGVKETLTKVSKQIQNTAKLPPPPQIIGVASPEENSKLKMILKNNGYVEMSPNLWQINDAQGKALS